MMKGSLRRGEMVLLAIAVAGLSFGEARSDPKKVELQLRLSRFTYSTPERWNQRRDVLREGFLKGTRLWPLGERRPIKAIIHSRRDLGDYSVENVALETLPGFYCTGNLYRPAKQEKPGPAILCPHGHFKPLGRFREEHQIRCAHFARMGATVFSYSMVGWQDSQQTTHDDPLVLALQTWNSIRVVDYLSGLKEVDPKRIGVTGASGGGTQTFYLAFLDDRIKVSAPVVIVYPWIAPDGCCKCEGGMPIMQATQTNAIEIAAAVAPRPQLIISVGKDQTKDFPQVGFPFIKHIYQLLGHAENAANVHLPAEEHDFGPSKRNAVYKFFARHLDMKLTPEDRSKITIEPPERMEVFNGQHPLPPGAARGSQAVAEAFSMCMDKDWPVAAVAKPLKPLVEYSFKESGPADEAIVFTPPGFKKVGFPAVADANKSGKLKITVKDRDTGKPTFCRVNVVGRDGNFYRPKENYLTKYDLTGEWPKQGWGNRQGKAPIRYLGRYFYCNGETEVEAPEGTVRVEVWKGFEYRPQVSTIELEAGGTVNVDIVMPRTANMAAVGWHSGDPHIHMKRENDADDQVILDLLEAEDIKYGAILAYNDPPGPYAGIMEKLASPQYRGLGRRSLRIRDSKSGRMEDFYGIMSGQEYRSGTYGHLNLFNLDRLVMEGQSHNADQWPPFGYVARDARRQDGFAFYAHGGYAQEIYADLVQGHIDGVELLQFGVYRGIGLSDWYRILNCGFRFPAIAASDYPACRKLGDCQTYVQYQGAGASSWLAAAANGRSFITTGPLLRLEVEGQKPGAVINDPPLARRKKDLSEKPRRIVEVYVNVISEVAPVTNIQLIVNGRVVDEIRVPDKDRGNKELALRRDVEVSESCWIAARAFSLSTNGTPDAEAHTNPVYVYVDGKAPYERESLDVLLSRIDGQIAIHKKRTFPEKAKVIAYFERSRDILLKIRDAGGVPANGHPSDIARDLPELQNPGARTHTEQELKEFLKPVPPRPIGEALKSFETVDGFRLELVAKEPLVNSPVAAAFDENGNLYVAEMRDYPYKPKPGQPPLGSVRLLIDKNGDGVFDEGHVFADQLLWAAGIAPWKGGVFVAAPPDIWYLKDTDGDHKADIRNKVFTGFGTDNQQAMLNNLVFGLDHKIYGATAGNGGDIRPGDKPDARTINVDGRDFRFDPATLAFETATGTVQFGNTFDDWGNRFVCSESQPLQHVVLPQHYLARNPYLAVPTAINNIAPGPVPIFRISPIERWRQIRSSRRIAHTERAATSAGASHHVVDAAAGVTVYRGGAYPQHYYGTVFVGDAQNNLVHHRALIPEGVTFKSARVENKTEFIRSSDNWFRPVNFVNAPDGTLYMLDMSREIIESIHIPSDVVKFLDLRAGRDYGRIYRIAPAGFRYPGSPQLGKATTAQLVSALESPHGWHRDTAHRLLYERQDSPAIEPLRRLLREGQTPQARLHALWSLHGLKALTDDDLMLGLADAAAGIRAHALSLSESRLDQSPKILEKVLALVKDADPRVRFQLAFTLGETRRPRGVEALAELARSSAADSWMRTAILSSANASSDRLLAELIKDKAFVATAAGISMCEQLAAMIGNRNQRRETNAVIALLAAEKNVATNPALQRRLVLALGHGLKRAGGRLPYSGVEIQGHLLKTLYDDACKSAAGSAGSESDRRSAVDLLSCFPFSFSRQTLVGLLDIRQPESIQIAAARALADYAEPEIAAILLKGWSEYVPTVREEALRALLLREERTLELLKAAEQGQASIATIDSTWRSLLAGHRNPAIQTLAKKLFGNESPGSRQEVLGAYKAALQLKGATANGHKVFQAQCMSCHRLGNEGYAVGPDLSSSAIREPAALLQHILDPNFYLLPNYVHYVAVDKNDRVFTGMISSQTAGSITLKRDKDAADTILRKDIEELRSTGKSLMPEGFEKTITPQEMADLIAFLQKFQTQPPADQRLEIGTLPGLVEPDR